MAYTLDAEIAAAMQAAAEAGFTKPVPPKGDWKALREGTEAMMSQMMTSLPPTPDVEIKVFTTKAKDGWDVEFFD